MSDKPTFTEYVCGLARRLEAAGPNALPMPTVLVVGLLGFAAEDERLDERDRSTCKGWLNRLVDEQGNPRDDRGRSVLQYALEENALNLNGSLTNLDLEDDRLTLMFTVLRDLSKRTTREAFVSKVGDHLAEWTESITDVLYGHECAPRITADGVATCAGCGNVFTLDDLLSADERSCMAEDAEAQS